MQKEGGYVNKKALSIALIFALLSGMLGWHFYEYINAYSKNPSSLWSRDLEVGEKSLNASSLLFYDDGKVYILWAKEQGFCLREIYPDIKEEQNILVKDFKESSAKKVNYRDGKIFWLQEGRLRELALNNQKEEDLGLKGGDFALTQNYILLSDEEGIKIFDFSASLVSFLTFSNVSKIDAFQKGDFIYIGFLTDNREENKVYYTYYDLKKGKWGKVVEIYKLFQTSTSHIDDVKIALDPKGVYVFYLITARNGSSAYYAYFPMTGKEEVLPSKVTLPASEVISFDLISFSEDIGGAFSVPVKYRVSGPFTQYGVEILWAKFKEGELKEVSFITKEGKWASAPYLISTPQGLFISWIETGGFSKYVIKVASTNKDFMQKVAGIRKIDTAKALSLLMYSLASAVFLGGIMSFVVTFPAYLWLIIGLFFESGIFKKESLNFYIAVILYTAFKYTVYPPKVLKTLTDLFPLYNNILIPIFTVVLALIFTKMYFKGKIGSGFGAFTFLWIVDSLITNIFYLPFMAK
jgi:hypothetical protein